MMLTLGLGKNLASVADAMCAFMHIVGLAKESLQKILLRREFGEYPHEKHMHCTARLADMLNLYSNDLHKCEESDPTNNFLMEENKVMEEAKWIGFPNFLPRTAFLTLLRRKVTGISSLPIGFIDEVWKYIETVVIAVLKHHSEHYYQLQMSTRRAGQSLTAKMRKSSINHVMMVVEMEKLTDYTCDPEYKCEYNKLIAEQNADMREVLVNEKKPSSFKLEGIGEIEIAHLRQYPLVIHQAFDLKMRMTAYWKIVLRRLTESIALNLQLSIYNVVNKDLGEEIVNDLSAPYGGGIEGMLEESPSVAGKRDKLNKSVTVLRQSKEILANIMDQISWLWLLKFQV